MDLRVNNWRGQILKGSSAMEEVGLQKEARVWIEASLLRHKWGFRDFVHHGEDQLWGQIINGKGSLRFGLVLVRENKEIVIVHCK